MTPVQIAYFKHFIFDCSLQRHYIGAYRKRRQKENPESLEEFLQQASPAKALIGAFYFKPGSEYGFDYWNDIKEKWLKYWELHEDNPKNSSYMFLKGGFSILRQNWDKEIFYERETDDETYKRMKIEKPDIDESVLTVQKEEKPSLPKFKIGDTVRGTISGDVCKIIEVNIKHKCYLTDDDGAIDFDREEYWELIPEAAQEVVEEPQELIDFSDIPEYQEQKKDEPKGFLDGFSIVETINPIGSKRIASNTISINLRKGSYKVTFNVKESDRIRKHSHRYVQLLTNPKTKEIALTFNNSKGCNVISKKDVKGTKNITVNSKEMVTSIRRFLGIKDDFFIMEIVSTTVINDNTTFILKYNE